MTAVVTGVGALAVTSNRAPAAPAWWDATRPVDARSSTSIAAAVTTASTANPTTFASAMPPITPASEAPWRQVFPFGVGVASELVDVTTTPRGVIVAAGRSGEAAAFIASSDAGTTWRVLPQTGLPASTAARSVAADNDRLAAVLTGASGSQVWELRADIWQPIALEAGQGDTVVLSSVALAGGRLVAGGYDSAGTGLWVQKSPEAQLQRVDRAHAPAASPGHAVTFRVARAGSGFSAVGRAGDGASRWMSDDGLTWSGTALPVAHSGAATFASADANLVAGYDGRGGVVWLVHDGKATATRMPTPGDYPQEPLFFAGNAQVAVLGVKEGAQKQCWHVDVTDDTRFEPCPSGPLTDPAANVRAVSIAPGHVLAVGSVGAETPRASVWIGDDLSR